LLSKLKLGLISDTSKPKKKATSQAASKTLEGISAKARLYNNLNEKSSEEIT